MKRTLNYKYLANLEEIADEVSQSSQMAKQFFDLFLTPDEIRSLVLRWEIVKRIHEGEATHHIARVLNVSTATVCRWQLEEWRWRWEA